MLIRSKLLRVCLVAAVLGCGSAVAQSDEQNSDEDNLIGFWRQSGASLMIQVERENDALTGVIVKEDWNPSLIGQVLFKDLQYNPKSKKWTGQLLSNEREEPLNVTIRMKRSGTEFTSRSKSRQHKNIKWKKTEP